MEAVRNEGMRDVCHPERAQILSERSESKDRHLIASRDLHFERQVQIPRLRSG